MIAIDGVPVELPKDTNTDIKDEKPSVVLVTDKKMRFNLYQLINSYTLHGKIKPIEIIIPYETKISDIEIGGWKNGKLIRTMSLKETIDNYSIEKVLLQIEDVGYCVNINKYKVKKMFEIKRDEILSDIDNLKEKVKLL